jgi:hypothetical protein
MKTLGIIFGLIGLLGAGLSVWGFVSGVVRFIEAVTPETGMVADAGGAVWGLVTAFLCTLGFGIGLIVIAASVRAMLE